MLIYLLKQNLDLTCRLLKNYCRFQVSLGSLLSSYINNNKLANTNHLFVSVHISYNKNQRTRSVVIGQGIELYEGMGVSMEIDHTYFTLTDTRT